MDKNNQKFSSIEDAVNWLEVLLSDGKDLRKMSNFVDHRCKVREREAGIERRL